MQLFGGGEEFAKKKDVINPNLLSNTDSFKDFYITGTNTPVNPIKDKLDPLGHVTSHATSTWQQAVHFLDIDTSSVYTLSAFIWVNGNQTIKAICRGSSGSGACQNNGTTINGLKNNCWQRISFTFQSFYESHVAFDFEATDGTADFWLGSYKLEKGSIATPWCPAIQDYAMKTGLMNYLLSGQSQTYVDDSFDLNSADIGVYRSWGKTPKNAPNGITAWCLYMVGYFSESEGSKFEIALDGSGNICYRTLVGAPLTWSPWRKITTTDAK